MRKGAVATVLDISSRLLQCDKEEDYPEMGVGGGRVHNSWVSTNKWLQTLMPALWDDHKFKPSLGNLQTSEILYQNESLKWEAGDTV